MHRYETKSIGIPGFSCHTIGRLYTHAIFVVESVNVKSSISLINSVCNHIQITGTYNWILRRASRTQCSVLQTFCFKLEKIDFPHLATELRRQTERLTLRA